MRFKDRTQAGKLLGDKLIKYRGKSVVYALPRGGVEVGAEVAKKLDAPLDLIISRKIGHPYEPEYAIGAVTESGPAIWNEFEASMIDPQWLQRAEAEERAEAKRRRKTYTARRNSAPVGDKTVIIIDDGIATGLTMLAAIEALRKLRSNKIMVAAPVAPPDVIITLREIVGDIITLDSPNNFQGAIGAHYVLFPQLSDAKVVKLLKIATRN